MMQRTIALSFCSLLAAVTLSGPEAEACGPEQLTSEERVSMAVSHELVARAALDRRVLGIAVFDDSVATAHVETATRERVKRELWTLKVGPQGWQVVSRATTASFTPGEGG